MENLKGNVINNTRFRDIMNGTLDYLANSVAQTFGPYGHNAIIQTTDAVYTTKDGWHTLQNINFTDPTRNAIKFMIESAASSIVLSVGDGSTTSTIAANEMNKLVQNLSGKYTIRATEDTLNACVDKIEAQLYAGATPIDEENLYDSIKKVALVSTNWNEELSDLIADSYRETHNPIIKIMDSGTDKTYIEYIDGYDLAGELQLKEYYNNDREHNRAIVQKPVILMFDHTVQTKYFLSLYCLSQVFRMIGRPIVIVAPGFEGTFVSKLATANQQCMKDKAPLVGMLLFKAHNFYNVDKDCIRDFSLLTGCIPINVDNDDFKDFMDDLSGTMMKSTEGLTEEEVNAINAEKHNMTDTAIQYVLSQFAGECDQLILDDKSLLAKGLPNIDSDGVAEIREAIRTEITTKIKEANALTILSDDIRMKRVRLGKLMCKMGIIKVGGYGSANIKAKKDALDDATRACEAAYRDGYTMGGTLSIIKAVTDILSNPESALTEIEADIYNCILDAFRYVYATLFVNKGVAKSLDAREILDTNAEVTSNNETINQVIANCVDNNYAFNILTDTYDTEKTIINPVTVDIQALKSCMKLVIISITSNQFIHKHYNFGESADITVKEV